MVAVKDMKMPSCCVECERFLGACKYDNFGDCLTERNPNCPLVEIKALEQEPILGKIRLEIAQLPTNYVEIRRTNSVVERHVVDVDAVMRILNKY